LSGNSKNKEEKKRKKKGLSRCPGTKREKTWAREGKLKGYKKTKKKKKSVQAPFANQKQSMAR